MHPSILVVSPALAIKLWLKNHIFTFFISLKPPEDGASQGSHSHGKSWKKSGHGKVMENGKNSEFHGNLFARKKVMEKSWKSVVLLCCDQCGSETLFLGVFNHLYSTTHLLYLYLETPLKGHLNGYISIMESHGILFLNLCGNPDIVPEDSLN